MAEPSIPKKRTTFYIDANLLKAFKTICFREDESMSRKVESYIARYIAVHSKGNPQLHLESWIGKTKRVCFFCEGKFDHLIRAKFVSGLIANTCEECLGKPSQQNCLVKVLGKVE